jgi:hypothetical protein
MKTFRLVAFLAFITLAGTASARNQHADYRYPHPHFRVAWDAGYYFAPPVWVVPPPPVGYAYYGHYRDRDYRCRRHCCEHREYRRGRR